MSDMTLQERYSPDGLYRETCRVAGNMLLTYTLERRESTDSLVWGIVLHVAQSQKTLHVLDSIWVHDDWTLA